MGVQRAAPSHPPPPSGAGGVEAGIAFIFFAVPPAAPRPVPPYPVQVIPVDRYGTSQDIGGAAQKCLAEGRPCLLQSGMLTLEKALGVAYQLRKQVHLLFLPCLSDSLVVPISGDEGVADCCGLDVGWRVR